MYGRFVLTLFVAALAAGLVSMPALGEHHAPGIEGQYRLVKRVLPDGSEVMPPDIAGYMSLESGFRNFNVAWSDAEGQPVALGMIAKYTLSATELCEDVVHWLQLNLGAPGLGHDPPADKQECSKISKADGKTRLDLNGELPYLIWNEDGFVATAESLFVDHWERVR